MLPITTNQRNILCVYSQYNIRIKLHSVINVFSCVKMSLLCDAYVIPTMIPPQHTPHEGEMVAINVAITWTNTWG